jgi:RNA polymerase sigma factor (sigma-70 family)
MSSDEGAKLLRAALEGDSEARERLVRAHSEPVRRWVEREMGPGLARNASVSDVCQETFVRALDSLHVLPANAGTAEFRGLVYRHARWALQNELRRHRHMIGESETDTPPAAVADGDEDRAGPVTVEDDRAWLLDNLDQLEPGLAAAVRLRFEGKDFGEIASELGIEYEAARKRCLRAAHELRRRVQRDEP